MKIDNIPFLGKINRAINAVVANFVLLAIVCLILGVVIPLFPQVLTFLVSALLIVAAVIFANIAYRIHHEKKKYFDWMGD